MIFKLPLAVRIARAIIRTADYIIVADFSNIKPIERGMWVLVVEKITISKRE